jgi:coproporphyrinogen III oxidase
VYNKCFKFVFEFITNLRSSFKYFNKDRIGILLSKLRISNHNLEIERGRHRGLQAKERICKLCLKEVEDEIHFLLKCEAYN